MTEPTYDYVIVGAGSAGCALAGRLSENPAISVLLLEAGPRDSNPWIHIPVGYFKTMYDSRLSWNYETEPEPATGNRRMVWPRGKVLGGSSSINGLIYMRGQQQDYDHWRQLGNAGWSWDDVLPYFRRAEDQERGADGLHGAGGPLGVANFSDDRDICRAYVAAAVEAGIPRNDDFNGAVQEGVGYYQLTARNGRRCSAAVGYLRPARKRPNLRIEVEALARCVIFEGRRATGVEYTVRGAARSASAGREVILSGGAINSPQILQLSGIGPADLLREHGIAVVDDRPGVGANLQDHYQVRNVYRCSRPGTLNDAVGTPLGKLRAALRYAVSRDGPLTFCAGSTGALVRTRPELETPDVQFHMLPLSVQALPPGAPPKLDREPGFTNSVCQLRPESRGTVRIKSPDPAAPPTIHPNYLDAQLDRDTVVAGFKISRKLCRSPALAPFVAQETAPGDAIASDDDILAFVRENGVTIFHPVGTCKMGDGDNATDAVVDARLRVHGVAGLRVVDASIMPTLVSGNTNAPAIMIGEKAADMIREDAV